MPGESDGVVPSRNTVVQHARVTTLTFPAENIFVKICWKYIECSCSSSSWTANTCKNVFHNLIWRVLFVISTSHADGSAQWYEPAVSQIHYNMSIKKVLFLHTMVVFEAYIASRERAQQGKLNNEARSYSQEFPRGQWVDLETELFGKPPAKGLSSRGPVYTS